MGPVNDTDPNEFGYTKQMQRPLLQYAMRTEKDSAQTKKHLCQSGFTFHEKCGSGSDPGIF
jgi:hypothetical protein